MIDRGQPHRSGGGTTTTEISVAGRLGPVLRAAFAEMRITTRTEFTVIRARPTTDEALADLVRTLVERGVVVQSVHRLSDVPAQRAPAECHHLGSTEHLPLRRRL